MVAGEQSSPATISRQGFAGKSLPRSSTFSKLNCSMSRQLKHFYPGMGIILEK
jgi:hypothetical protein